MYMVNKYRSHYSQEELNILNHYYPIGGVNLCHQYLPHRTEFSISIKAGKLGLTVAIKKGTWTQEEFDILKTYYPLGGKVLAKQHLPNRSLVSVWQTAKKLGLDYQYKNLKTWTKEESEFLKQNYSSKGAEYCSQVLNKSSSKVRARANNFGLILDKPFRVDKEKVLVYRDFNNIFDLNNPKILYLLGFIWADGYIGKTVTISNVSKDLDEIIEKIDLVKLLLGVSIKYRQPQRNGWQPQTAITFGNKEVIQFLVDNNYTKSRLNEPIILDKISEHLKHYWFRGYLDGDGCIYYIASNKAQCYLSFSGNSHSTYQFLQDLGQQFSVVPSIKCRKSRINSTYARVTFEGIKRALPILDYIYQGWDEFNLGLERKYQKYLLLKTTF